MGTLTTAWCSQDGENPWLLDCYDEIGFDVWGGEPDHFTEHVKVARSQGSDVRIVEFKYDDKQIETLFAATQLNTEVKDD